MGDLRRVAWPRMLFCVLLAALCIESISSHNAFAEPRQRVSARSIASIGDRINSNTISIISGNLNATYISIAYDLSAVLDDGNELRILPIIGKGGGQNIKDVRFLRGIDLGITQSNLLNVFRRTNEIGPIDDKVLYIARLFNEEMHVVVRADSGITSIDQLDGKKVNFSDIGSGTQLSTRDILDHLGVKAVEVNMPQNDAYEALKRGEIAATVLIAGKPTGSNSKLKASDGWRILPVPFRKPLQADYLPTTLTHNDYPNLIEAGRSVDTVAVGAVLIAYNWARDTDRYRRIAKFVNAFFPRLADFQKRPRHPKWREANLTATVPGWKRFAAAEEWLDRNRQTLAVQSAERQKFDEFLSRDDKRMAAAASPEQREKLFQEFLKWSQAQTHN
jgi:TRAP transporter TAXI family solute receptor